MVIASLHLGSWLRLFRPGPWVAPFVPTPEDVVPKMLTLARLQPGESVLDLGCGDGRLLSTAVRQFGAARATGYELDEQLAALARQRAGDDPRIEVRVDDLALAGPAISEADVVTLYLSNTGNARLLPLLRQWGRPSSRVVTYFWEMPVPASKSIRMTSSGAPVHLFDHEALLRCESEKG